MFKDNFYKATIFVIGVLTILIAVFVYLNSLRGPHVRNIELEGQQMRAEYVDQRLRIQFSRPIQRENVSELIKIEPDAEYSISFIRNDLQLIFSENLNSNQEYKLTVSKDLKDIYNESLIDDYTFTFKTKEQKFAFIKKADPEETNSKDKVIESSIDLKSQITLFESDQIKYFVRYSNLLAVVEINPDRTQNLVLLENGDIKKDFKFQNKNIISIDLVAPNHLLYILQSVEARDNFLIPQNRAEIFIYDIQKEEGRVFNPKNTGVDAIYAKFSPDGSSAIYKTSDSFFYLSEISEESDPIAIGRFQTTGGFNPKLNKIIFTEFDPLQNYSSFPFISIFSSDREISNVTDGTIYILDPTFFKKTDDIIYAERHKELEGTAGIFKIVSIIDDEKIDILEDKQYSLEIPKVSFDDRYLLIEKYSQFDLLDYKNQRDFFNYRKPLYADLVIYDMVAKKVVGVMENSIEGEWLK